MADRADVYVKNTLKEHLSVRRIPPGGKSDMELTLQSGEREKVYLPGPEVVLEIFGPDSMDLKDCLVTIATDVDLEMTCSRSRSAWTFRVTANELNLDLPTTVNVSIGENEP